LATFRIARREGCGKPVRKQTMGAGLKRARTLTQDAHRRRCPQLSPGDENMEKTPKKVCGDVKNIPTLGSGATFEC